MRNRLALNFPWPVVFLHRLRRHICSGHSGYVVIGKDAAFASESNAITAILPNQPAAAN